MKGGEASVEPQLEPAENELENLKLETAECEVPGSDPGTARGQPLAAGLTALTGVTTLSGITTPARDESTHSGLGSRRVGMYSPPGNARDKFPERV